MKNELKCGRNKCNKLNMSCKECEELNRTYKFKVERSDFTDKNERNIRVSAVKGGTSHGLPLLNFRELNILCNEIIDYLSDEDNAPKQLND